MEDLISSIATTVATFSLGRAFVRTNLESSMSVVEQEEEGVVDIFEWI